MSDVPLSKRIKQRQKSYERNKRALEMRQSGMGYKEVAEAFGISVSYAKAIIDHAKQDPQSPVEWYMDQREELMRTKLEPTTTDPLLLEIFKEADRQGIPLLDFALKAGMHYHALVKLRRPPSNHKGAQLASAQKLAKAIGREIVLK